MKYCHDCGQLFKNELELCAHDGTRLIDIKEAFSTHKKPDPVMSLDDLPYIDVPVEPHEDWPTWQARQAQRLPSREPAEVQTRNGGTNQRRKLTSMGFFVGVTGFLLQALTMLPAHAAAVNRATARCQSVAYGTPTPANPKVSSSTVVIVTKTGTVIQKMSSMSPQELWSSPPPPTAKSQENCVNSKVARISSTGPGKFSTPTAR